MSLSILLAHLDGIKETAHGKYVARCPSHDDRSPSLAIKECGDGRVLIHCFAGCETEDVLSAVGLTFADVMPERLPEHRYRSLKPAFDARQVLECLSHELMVVNLLAERYASIADADDQNRLMRASSRICCALRLGSQFKTPPEQKVIRRAEQW